MWGKQKWSFGYVMAHYIRANATFSLKKLPLKVLDTWKIKTIRLNLHEIKIQDDKELSK